MPENQASGWSGLGSNYAQDNSQLSQDQSMNNILAGSGMGASQPQISSLMSNGISEPSSLNGYPIFSSSQAGASSPSGYANANPIDSTPSVIQTQARGLTPSQMPQNPQMPTPATMNPWAIRQSSTPGASDYPQPGAIPAAKLNVL